MRSPGASRPFPRPTPRRNFWRATTPNASRSPGTAANQLLYLVKTPARSQGLGAAARYPDAGSLAPVQRGAAYGRATSEVCGAASFLTWDLLAAGIWLVALALVWLVATRFSRPIVNLTEALKSLADGNFRIRVPNERTDEIGLATEAFNRTAAQLEQSRDRLVYLTQLASWQVLARKTAHEVKNSLTPIRLTVEEMVARGQRARPGFSGTGGGHRRG